MPFTAFVARREAQRGTGLAGPPRRNVRVDHPELGDARAPDTPRSGDFYLEGKPRNHAESHSWIALSTPHAATQAVSEQRHGMIAGSKVEFTQHATRPRGRQGAWGGTPNVERPAATIFGDLVTLAGDENERLRGAQVG
jgi:hypothetical protein